MNSDESKIITELVSSLKGPIKKIGQFQEQKLALEKENIEYIINNKIKNELEIERVLDNLINLTYWYGLEIKDTYYKLLNYFKNINVKLSEEYEKYYLEIIEEDMAQFKL